MMQKKKALLKDIAAIRELFKKEGIKLTHQRLEILKEISGSREHPSSEELYRQIHPRMPTISLDTIYRALERFERMGLISRVEVLDDQIRYDPNTKTHHHFVCIRCKNIEDFYWPNFDGIKTPSGMASWGRTLSRHVEFRGICKRCLTQRAVSRDGLREANHKKKFNSYR